MVIVDEVEVEVNRQVVYNLFDDLDTSWTIGSKVLYVPRKM